jgi:hypothetical protein
VDNVGKIEITLPPRKFEADRREIIWINHLTTPSMQPGAQALLPAEASTSLRRVADYIDQNIDPFPDDSNVQLALKLAEELAKGVRVPPSVTAMTPEQRADLILDLVKLDPRERLPVDLGDHAPFVRIATLIATIATKSAASIPDVPDALERVSLVLRMWAGCLATGKTIADGTRSGPNTQVIREQNARAIDAVAAGDLAFEVGMSAAVSIKLREHKTPSFDGVPPGTRVYDLRNLLRKP